jgi:predicted transglutaminase-like cysteine proteinase
MRKSDPTPAFQHSGLRIYSNKRHCNESVFKLFAPIAIAVIILATANTVTAAPSSPVTAPSFFSSIGLRVTKTPFQQEWAHIANAPLGAAGQALVNTVRQADTRVAQVRSINTAVNHRLTYRDDSRLFGAADYWATPMESLSRRAGDCEDYAILKRAALLAIGVPDNDMFLVILRDIASRADHAVLTVRVEGQILILDNRNDQLSVDHGQADYRPIFSFNGAGAWAHGYARQPTLPAIKFAAVTPPRSTPNN